MLRWICSHTRRDRIKNDDIQDKLGVASIQKKLVQHCLSWFDHIQRKPPEAPIHSGILSRPENTRKGKDRPRFDMRGNNKKGFEGMKYIQEACFG
jgi:hypothetical protein